MPLSAFVVGFSALLDRIEGNGVKIVLVEDARADSARIHS
jgi:hypothetical protein